MTKSYTRARKSGAILAWSLAAFAAGTLQLQAASGDAWEEFAQDVQQACLSAALGTVAVSSIQVDPYGSESYGFAVMVGVEAGTSNERLVACAYDKATQKAEISSVFNR